MSKRRRTVGEGSEMGRRRVGGGGEEGDEGAWQQARRAAERALEHERRSRGAGGRGAQGSTRTPGAWRPRCLTLGLLLPCAASPRISSSTLAILASRSCTWRSILAEASCNDGACLGSAFGASFATPNKRRIPGGRQRGAAGAKMCESVCREVPQARQTSRRMGGRGGAQAPMPLSSWTTWLAPTPQSAPTPWTAPITCSAPCSTTRWPARTSHESAPWQAPILWFVLRRCPRSHKTALMLSTPRTGHMAAPTCGGEAYRAPMLSHTKSPLFRQCSPYSGEALASKKNTLTKLRPPWPIASFICFELGRV